MYLCSGRKKQIESKKCSFASVLIKKRFPKSSERNAVLFSHSALQFPNQRKVWNNFEKREKEKCSKEIDEIEDRAREVNDEPDLQLKGERKGKISIVYGPLVHKTNTFCIFFCFSVRLRLKIVVVDNNEIHLSNKMNKQRQICTQKNWLSIKDWNSSMNEFLCNNKC